MSYTDADFNADALLTLIETEHEAFDIPLTLRCERCPWRRHVCGLIEASVVGQSHQLLHSQLGPSVPAITLHGLLCAGCWEVRLPGWRATGAETIQTETETIQTETIERGSP